MELSGAGGGGGVGGGGSSVAALMMMTNSMEVIHPLLSQLDDALALEHKFQPHIQLPPTAQDGSEVTLGIRDGSAHVLRCLKVWYDLPSDVLFIATNLMDRFLTKMKVRPKHMGCISVACFQLACRAVVSAQPSDILAISQCKCSRGDLGRMQAVITGKLASNTDELIPVVTPIVFLRLFHALFSAIDVHGVYARAVGEEGDVLCQKLEVIACDGSSCNFRACEVALVLVATQLDSGVAALGSSQPPPASAVIALVSAVAHLQHICQISERNFYLCHAAVLSILARYNAETQTPHRQRLVWRVSARTLRRLRPTDRLVTTLQTIDEHGQLHLPPPHHHRAGSSSESTNAEEDDEDGVSVVVDDDDDDDDDDEGWNWPRARTNHHHHAHHNHHHHHHAAASHSHSQHHN